ncbi:DUF2332 domain-containing protein [Oleiagrimonas sp. C23AA]|uniref:DUF2332 domain-containing protein n=1 Tax=Oleiagrimonas sp. C23AA TaxID=2719047 RepID=UPI001423D9A6|nr:DUF2332 domain-containing protein [Oleiagrimonas sp. C23AA]NII11701.1 DUF2332 domain-containing protein [Oleiagrimonas sp. C23AA]
MSTVSDALVEAFTRQIEWCERLGSPFTARVLRQVVVSLQAPASPMASVAELPSAGGYDALPLRVAAALHGLVLSGRAPALAEVYPGGAEAWCDDESLRFRIESAWRNHVSYAAGYLASVPQTNEVGRSAAFVGGFLHLARRYRMPLRLLELGASAGLNLMFDHYRYSMGDAHWGPVGSRVHMRPRWEGELPDVGAPLRVAQRAGCDLFPVDVSEAEARLRLRAYIWADQRPRLRRLELALDEVGDKLPLLQGADAALWLESQLATAVPGQLTVVFHSLVWDYLPEATRERIQAAMTQAGSRADARAPLAWMRLEPGDDMARPQLTLTTWPGGETRLLAETDAHGGRIEWRAQPLVETSSTIEHLEDAP